MFTGRAKSRKMEGSRWIRKEEEKANEKWVEGGNYT